MQDVQVLEAYTLRPDGHKIQVMPTAIMTKESPASMGAPMFSDAKIKVIVFPEVTVGAKLFIEFKFDQKIPLFPGHFFLRDWMPLHVPFGNYQIDMTAPKELALYSESRYLKEERWQDQDGTRHWRWTGANANPIAPEPGAVDGFDYAPRLVVSSFQNYASFAKAYQDRAQDKAKVTPKIQALADQITKDIADRQETIRALYHWVSKNIRYVAIYLNAGGVVPHDAETILGNRYGDCKDHVVLLEALLAAKGIASSPALINLGNAYSLPQVAALHVFNHVITYLPEEQLYLDSTAQYAPFGMLPSGAIGKDVLLTATGQLSRTPAMTSAENGTYSKVTIKIHADGSATGSSEINAKGMFEVNLRARIASEMAQPGERVVANLLAKNKENGSGTINRGEPGNLEKPYVLTSAFNIDSLVSLAGPGALTVPLGISSTDIENFANSTTLKGRQFPYVCGSSTFEEERIIEFPSGMKIVAVPKNTQFSNKYVQYTSSYALQGQKLMAKRRYQSTRPSRVCDPADYALSKELARVVQRDLRAPILFEGVE